MTLMSMFGYRFNKSIILTDKIDAKKGTKAISFLVLVYQSLVYPSHCTKIYQMRSLE